jgi:hypothetical protein
MIRASENGVKLAIMNNNGYYRHVGESEDDSIQRTTTEVKDRLPMNDLTNERYFKLKWISGWSGWEPYLNQVDKPHPPTHISQVQRTKPEIDAHPLYTKKYL